MNILSAFLSHKSDNKDLVREVALHLGRRGIRPWLDEQELPPGVDLRARLRTAVASQHLCVVFLSAAAIDSSWVRDELDIAIELEEAGRTESIVPVFLAGYTELVRSHPRLRRLWMDAAERRVERLGIDGVRLNAAAIAAEIATRAYEQAGTRERPELAVLVDQRGSGAKRGLPTLPAAIEAMDGPALLFRPDMAERSAAATVAPADWDTVADTMRRALIHAIDLNPVRKQRIHWFGTCQMALAALFGSVVERSSGKELVLHDLHGRSASIDLGRFHEPLRGGTASAPTLVNAKEAAVVLTKTGHLGLADARRDAADRRLPLVEVLTPDVVATGDDVLEVARSLTATVVAMRDQGMQRLFLYNLGAAHMLAAVVSLLMHVVEDLIILEWSKSEQTYRPFALRPSRP
jgi:hypothetical protein